MPAVMITAHWYVTKKEHWQMDRREKQVVEANATCRLPYGPVCGEWGALMMRAGLKMR